MAPFLWATWRFWLGILRQTRVCLHFFCNPKDNCFLKGTKWNSTRAPSMTFGVSNMGAPQVQNTNGPQSKCFSWAQVSIFGSVSLAYGPMYLEPARSDRLAGAMSAILPCVDSLLGICNTSAELREAGAARRMSADWFHSKEKRPGEEKWLHSILVPKRSS